ncbi:hypothetical protein CCP4SC76_5660002 [Gammaproteobacteria bacterium]
MKYGYGSVEPCKKALSISHEHLGFPAKLYKFAVNFRGHETLGVDPWLVPLQAVAGKGRQTGWPC